MGLLQMNGPIEYVVRYMVTVGHTQTYSGIYTTALEARLKRNAVFAKHPEIKFCWIDRVQGGLNIRKPYKSVLSRT